MVLHVEKTLEITIPEKTNKISEIFEESICDGVSL